MAFELQALVPEPATLLLFGLGAVILSSNVEKKMSKSVRGTL